MAYSNPEDQRAASKRHYIANKQRYLDRNTRYRKLVSDYIRDIKEKSPCVDCGVSYPYYIMDFDHLDGQQKINTISFLASTGRIGALKKEIVKCEVVCANCHRKRTYTRAHKLS